MVLLKFFDGTSHLHCTYGHAPELQQPPTQVSRCRRLLGTHDAVKASVPKLFGCPGSPSALSGFRFGDLVGRSENLQHRRLAPPSVVSLLARVSPSQAVQKHNTWVAPIASNGVARDSSPPQKPCGTAQLRVAGAAFRLPVQLLPADGTGPKQVRGPTARPFVPKHTWGPQWLQGWQNNR